MPFRACLVVLLTALLGACAELTAERPLFSTSDQIGPPPLSEGVWIAVQDDCPASYARRRRFPAACSPTEIRRLPDGAWEARFRADLVSHLSAEERAQSEDYKYPIRLIIIPATERSTPDAFAPLYVAEVIRTEPENYLGYAVIAPIGAMPATDIRIIGSIGCGRILSEGPIEGVTPRYRTAVGADGVEEQQLSGCVASTPAAVREAARRALVESVESLIDSRYIRARP